MGAGEKILIYDTTLRDGTQGTGISLSVEDKLRVAVRLGELGIDYVEGGWPGSNPKDAEFFRRAAKLDLGARLVAFGSTCRAGRSAEEDPNLRELVAALTPAAAIVGKAWAAQVERVLGVTREENLRMVRESVAFLKRAGREVLFDAEHFFDGYLEDPDYAMAVLEAAVEGGVDWLVLCDTRGGTLPGELPAVLTAVRGAFSTAVAFHAHNDAGVAVANSLVAAQHGVAQLQGTINGYGERCGNANLCSVIPNLGLKLGIPCIPPERLRRLAGTARFVSELANLSFDESQPYVGSHAFSHKAGLHVGAVLKDATFYEHVPPEALGMERRVLVSELAGRSNLLYKAREGGWDLGRDDPRTQQLLDRLKELEHHGYQFEGAEASFELLVRRTLGETPELFRLHGYRVLVDERGVCEASVKVEVAGKVVHTAADGDGPVHALDRALRKALQEFYPALERIHLVDYKVRVLEGRDGTASLVRVLIESKDDADSWSTVGVSANILEASWQALVDSLSYGLLVRS